MDEPEIPLYYMVRRDLSEDEIELVLHAFAIHPVHYAITDDYRDTSYALKFADACIVVKNPRAEALKFDEPTVVIGEIEQPWEPVYD